jgi:hypothetical protein
MPKTAIQVRVSTEQREAIRARADRAGLNLSDYIRGRALGEVEAPTGKVSPPTSPATPSASPEPEPVEPSPPAADDDLEAKIERRAQQLHARMSKSSARAQARRELS